MSDAIRFLESLGANAAMARMTAEGYEAAIAMVDGDQPIRDALLFRDHARLNELLDGRHVMFCFVAAPAEEEPGREESPSEGEGEDEKKQAE